MTRSESADRGKQDARARRSRRLSIAALSTLACVVLAELLCRLLVPLPMRVEVQVSQPVLAPADPSDKVLRLTKRPGQGGVYVQTPTGRRLRANTTAVIEKHGISGLEVEIRTNSLGYRGPELGDKAGRRFLFLGDSITFADYLPEEESFVRQIETLARAKGLDWETINSGVGSISLKTELTILLETGLTVQPDVVVLCWYLNDFQDSPGVEVHNPGFLAQHSRLAFALSKLGKPDPGVGVLQVPWKKWWAEWTRDDLPGLTEGDGERAAFYQEVGTAFYDWGGAWSPHAWDEMHPLLEEIVRVSREAGAVPVWLAFPARPQVEAAFDTSLPQRRLAEIAEELQVPLLDLLPFLRELDARTEAPLFYDQCHHTGEASRALAQAIFDWLETL